MAVKEFKDRPSHHVLSDWSSRSKFYVSIFTGLFGLSLLYLLLFSDSLTDPLFRIPASFFVFGLLGSSILHYKSSDFRHGFISERYDPSFELKRYLYKMGPWLPVLFCFVILILVIGLLGMRTNWKAITLVLPGVIGFMGLSKFVSDTLEFRKKQKYNVSQYGITTIKIYNSTPYEIGQQLRVSLNNENLLGQELIATLRNLSENHSGNKQTPNQGKVNSKSKRRRKEIKVLKSLICYEEVQIFMYSDSTEPLQFTLSAESTVPTKLSIGNPDYWELEFKGVSSAFYARFILNVV